MAGGEEFDLDYQDLAPKQLKVRVGEERFILQEASEGDAATWQNFNLSCNRYNDDGAFIGREGLADSSSLLISLCLHRTNGDGKVKIDAEGNPVRVEQAVVKRWLNRVTTPLFQEAKRISQLEEFTEESIIRQIQILQKQLAAIKKSKAAAKNGQDATLDTSA